MITIFENFEKTTKPNLNNYSEDLFRLIQIADWQQVINKNNNRELKEIEIEKMKGRIFKKFEYEDFINLSTEYLKLEKELKKYFTSLWLSQDNPLNVSDDGYWDLISSIIGKGKIFINDCINDKNILIDMAKKENYSENFSYIWQTTYKEYVNIRSKYDPLYKDINKFNL
jgi:hypothetical protein